MKKIGAGALDRCATILELLNACSAARRDRVQQFADPRETAREKDIRFGPRGD